MRVFFQGKMSIHGFHLRGGQFHLHSPPHTMVILRGNQSPSGTDTLSQNMTIIFFFMLSFLNLFVLTFGIPV
jgi:hypothetical protein